MRLLLVSDSMVGGSGRSQRDLSSVLVRRGHEVLILVDPVTRSWWTRWVYEQLSDAAARFSGSLFGRLLARAATLPGRHALKREVDGLAHVTSPVVQNAAARAIRSFQPDVVVASSISTLGWRNIRALCTPLALPTVLYLREDSAFGHFERGVAPADALIANAETLAQRARSLGYECTFLPSVVDLEPTRVDTTREKVLAVNPIESRGVHTVWALAARMPHIPFVVQESWTLDANQLGLIEHQQARLPNVELRRAQPPGPELYRDARVLLVPYRDGDRPRIIVEAHANGIPVVCGQLPALVDAVGPGGICLPLDDLDSWCAAIDALWSDAEAYAALSAAAVLHSRRPEISAQHIAAGFEQIVGGLLDAPGAATTAR